MILRVEIQRIQVSEHRTEYHTVRLGLYWAVPHSKHASPHNSVAIIKFHNGKTYRTWCAAWDPDKLCNVQLAHGKLHGLVICYLAVEGRFQWWCCYWIHSIIYQLKHPPLSFAGILLKSPSTCLFSTAYQPFLCSRTKTTAVTARSLSPQVYQLLCWWAKSGKLWKSTFSVQLKMTTSNAAMSKMSKTCSFLHTPICLAVLQTPLKNTWSTVTLSSINQALHVSLLNT